MLFEVECAQEFFREEFGDEQPKPGAYSVPIDLDEGKRYMKVSLSEDGGLSDFSLYADASLKIPTSWSD